MERVHKREHNKKTINNFLKKAEKINLFDYNKPPTYAGGFSYFNEEFFVPDESLVFQVE